MFPSRDSALLWAKAFLFSVRRGIFVGNGFPNYGEFAPLWHKGCGRMTRVGLLLDTDAVHFRPWSYGPHATPCRPWHRTRRRVARGIRRQISFSPASQYTYTITDA
eukprot:3286567-Pleurochrysis_carterae.AAC.1